MATDVESSPRIETHEDGPPVGELLKKLRNEATALFRQELRLAKVETTEKARAAGKSGMVLAVGGACLLLGAVFLLLALSNVVTAVLIVAGVSRLASFWLGPLIVGVVVCIVGYILYRKGMNEMKGESLMPERTIQTLQEEKEWVKQKLR